MKTSVAVSDYYFAAADRKAEYSLETETLLSHTYIRDENCALLSERSKNLNILRAVIRDILPLVVLVLLVFKALVN